LYRVLRYHCLLDDRRLHSFHLYEHQVSFRVLPHTLVLVLVNCHKLRQSVVEFPDLALCEIGLAQELQNGLANLGQFVSVGALEGCYGFAEVVGVGSYGAGGANPVLNLLFLLELIEGSPQGNHVHFGDIETEVVEGVYFDGSLGGCRGTSVLQAVQVMDVLMYPTKGF